MPSVTRIRALVGLALALGLAGLATGCVGAHKHHKAKPARTLAPVTKRSGCRLHGGLSPGAPRGPKNGNYKNGDWTIEVLEERKWLRSLVQSFAKMEGY